MQRQHPQDGEARFRALAESSFDAFYLLDAERDGAGAVVDYRCTELNQRAAERFGRPRSEILGRRLSELYSADLLDDFYRRCTRVVETQQPLDEETQVTLASGQQLWVHRRILPLGDGVAVTSRDISLEKREHGQLQEAVEALRTAQEQLELKVRERTAELTRQVEARERAELALRASEAQLLQAQKLEAIGLLAGGVAHDFNNVLTVILANAWLMRASTSRNDPVNERLEEIAVAAKRAATLTGQLLAFSRRQVLHPRVVCLNEVLAGIDKMVQRLIGEHIRVTWVQAPDLGFTRVDPNQVEQVLMNLIVNARDAMPRGGSLTLETANVDLDVAAAAAHPGLVAGPHVKLVVADDGTGMDAATQARIFEPFFTTKGLGKGTGLGLSIVSGIVNQSGGAISVHSEPGMGTRFELYFPRTGPPAHPERVPALPPPPGGGLRGDETVLLVDDDDQVRRATTLMLSHFGYQIIEARGAGDALLLAEQYREPIHILLSDLVMPLMDGRALAGRLVALRPGLKVLFTSGFADGAQPDAAEGDVPVVEKPFTAEELTGKLREVLEGS